MEIQIGETVKIPSNMQALRKPPTAEELDQKLKEAAQLYEKQFLRFRPTTKVSK